MEIFDTILKNVFLFTSGIVPVFLFCSQLKRRKYFILWVLIAIALMALHDIIVDVIDFGDGFILHSLFNIAAFFIQSLAMWLCFNDKYLTILFCCNAGKCTRHIAVYISQIIFTLTSVANTWISLVIFALIYAVMYFLFARRIKSEECVNVNNIKIILLTFFLLTGTEILYMAFSSVIVQSNVKIIMLWMMVLLCLVLLFLQFGLFLESKMKRESELINQLHTKEREQFEISQETIKLIGIKQHDIKNMLESNNQRFSREEIDAITATVDAYDIAFKTGNHALDVILTEKNIVCKNKKIRLECLADGEKCGFISDMDIYSLFLNALNNAIESAEKINEDEKRVIWLKVYTQENLLFIQVQNYYTEEIVFTNKSLISTTKADKKYHGYGLQSMQMIAKSYGGEMSIKTDNNIFSLGFVIPIP